VEEGKKKKLINKTQVIELRLYSPSLSFFPFSDKRA